MVPLVREGIVRNLLGTIVFVTVITTLAFGFQILFI